MSSRKYPSYGRMKSMADEGSTAGLYILIAFLIILVVGALLWFGGVFKKKTEVDININKPGIVLQISR
jgi:hypothetical protein